MNDFELELSLSMSGIAEAERPVAEQPKLMKTDINYVSYQTSTEQVIASRNYQTLNTLKFVCEREGGGVVCAMHQMDKNRQFLIR